MRIMSKIGWKLCSYIGNFLFLIVLFGFSLTLLSFLNIALAITEAIDDISIIVPASCTFSDATTDGNYAANIIPGNYNDDIGSEWL